MSCKAPRWFFASATINTLIITASYLASPKISRYCGHVAAWLLLNDLRVLYGDPTERADFLVFSAQVAWTWRSILRRWIMRIWLTARTRNSSLSWSSSLVFILGAVFVTGIVKRNVAGLLRRRRSKQLNRQIKKGILSDGDDKPRLKPLIFPCRTTHTRTFPKHHSFEYSYLLVGVPVPWKGIRTGIVSADTGGNAVNSSKRGWLELKAEDYLERGSAELGLEGKLREALNVQGVGDDEWQEAYLVTAPRILGYSFNPVSFWYIYGHDQTLKMMILEVNNTFDERRIYLLRAQSSSSEDLQSNGKLDKMKTFKNVWEKDFHVSPFNSLKGSYSLKATDPFNPESLTVEIDNTITLISSKNHAKLVARIFLAGPPLDPSTLNWWDTVRFMARYWWVGLVTFPRIVREAGRLFFVRGLHVWFRPEVALTSIGRRASTEEIILERFFEQYLSSLVDLASEPLRVTYRSAISNREVKDFTSLGACDSSHITPKHLELRVLSPAFYSRFVHYAHTSEAFDNESLCTDPRNRTVWLSNPENLHLILPKLAKHTVAKSGWMESTRWGTLRRLRCAPRAPAYPTMPSQFIASSTKNTCELSFSDMDHVVRHSCENARIYRRTVTRIFLAQWLAFGFIEMLNIADLVFRALLIVAYMPEVLSTGETGQPAGGGEWPWMTLMGTAIGVGAAHGWACLKGAL